MIHSQIKFLFLLMLIHHTFPRNTLQLIILTQNGLTFPEKGHISKYLNKNISQYNIPENSEDLLRGQLTGNGIRQEYLLGEIISEKYQNFLSTQIKNLDEIFILSSPVISSSMSAQNLTLGLLGPNSDERTFYTFGKYSFPPFSGDVPDNSKVKSALPFGYYPFTVKTTAANYDDIFRPYSSNVCLWFYKFNLDSLKLFHKYKNEVNIIVNDTPILQKLVKEIKNNPNLSSPYIKTIYDVFNLVDYLKSMKKLGVDFNLHKSIWDLLILLNDILMSQQYFDEEGLQVILTPLVKNIKSKIDQMISSISNPMDNIVYPKVAIYSGYDITIWALLQLFGMSSTSCLEEIFNRKLVENCFMKPDFGSNIIFELYRDENSGQLFIGKIFND
jgi:hypothetical protein